MVFEVTEIWFKSNYYIYETKDVFSTHKFVNINIMVDVYSGSSGYDNAENFIDRLSEKYSNDFGYFMYMSPNYDVNGERKIEDTLYLSEDILSMGKLELENVISSDDYISGYVCKNRLEEYPVGTIFENANTGSEIMIVGYFDAGSKWFPDLLFASADASVTLDNYIVSMMDNSYFEYDSMFYANLFNTLYVKTENDTKLEDIKEDIRQMADENKVKCYTYTLNELIDREKDDNKDLLKAVGILMIFVVIVSMTGILSASMADVLSRHYDIAIMSLNGVSPLDLYIMLLVENLIKIVIAYGGAVIWYLSGISGTEKIIFGRMVLPVVSIGILIFCVIITTISFLSFRKKNLLTLMGGVRL
jgi:ABC-type antimicrobial peptide transport system permease subunit